MRIVNDVYLARAGTIRIARTANVVMEPVVADITLMRRDAPTVHILDHNGVRTGRTLPVRDGTFSLDTGRDKTPFYLITW